MRLNPIVLGGVALLAAVASGASLFPEMVDDCRDKERADVPRLQEVANVALGSLGPSWDTSSACEDTGRPGAAVMAELSQWQHRSEAKRYLKARGWVIQDGSELLRSPDGETSAQIIRWTDDGKVRSIVVSFARR